MYSFPIMGGLTNLKRFLTFSHTHTHTPAYHGKEPALSLHNRISGAAAAAGLHTGSNPSVGHRRAAYAQAVLGASSIICYALRASRMQLLVVKLLKPTSLGFFYHPPTHHHHQRSSWLFRSKSKGTRLRRTTRTYKLDR